MNLPSEPAAPLEWHPAYRDKTWLIDWVSGEGHITIVLPILTRAVFSPEPVKPTAMAFKTVTMTRHKAWGPAAYVGRPFFYTWYVGVDDLGRQIASDSEIHYEPGY